MVVFSKPPIDYQEQLETLRSKGLVIDDEKEFIPVASLEGCSCNECPYMRLNTIEKMISALETLQPEIIMDEELRLRALKPLERMLELSL